MDKYDKLEKLKKLLDEGAISQAEYEAEKLDVLSETEGRSSQFWGMREEEYCMFMHLSQFLGFVVPFAGLIMPIVMWMSAKDYSNTVDNHGRIIINWIVSFIIYFIIAFILIFVLIGIPLMAGLVVVNVIFMIIGAIKARNGVEWQYPMSIPFFNRA